MNRWRTREFAYKRDVERLLKEVRQENEKQTELIKYLIENLGQEEKQRLEVQPVNRRYSVFCCEHSGRHGAELDQTVGNHPSAGRGKDRNAAQGKHSSDRPVKSD